MASRPDYAAFYPILVHQPEILPPASFGSSVTGGTLAFRSRFPESGPAGDFHPLVFAHAGRTRGRDGPFGAPPARIPAGAFNALGSCLGFWRRSAVLARDARFARVEAIFEIVCSFFPSSTGHVVHALLARGASDE